MRGFYKRNDEKHKCSVSQLKEEEVADIITSELEMLEWNEESWKQLKSTLFKSEDKDFIDFELKELRKEKTINEKKIDKLTEAYINDDLSADIIKAKQETLKARQEEITERLNELEDDRANYEERYGKTILILDSMRNFNSIWNKLSIRKKVNLLRLITVKILVNTKRVTIKGKVKILKDIEVIYNKEFNELFNIGLMKRVKAELPPNHPQSGIFTSTSFGDG